MKTSNHSTRKVSIGSNYPQAWITVTKNRQKVYNSNQIFLRDGQEFEIEMFNPTTETYLAKIKLNNNYISQRGIVIYPGQRLFLDRFIDENGKLTFSTYEVENTKEAKKAIEKNGLVSVEFYAEEKILNPTILSSGSTITWKNPYYYTDNWVNLGTVRGKGSSGTLGGSTFTTNLMGSITNIASYFSGESQFSSLSNSADTKSIETGRVERGEESEQSFEQRNGNFSPFFSYESSFHIMPVSTKPVEVSEIRNYCTSCGMRAKKQNWQFCPRCGHKL